MILVRDVFRLKFGKAKDAKKLMEESKKLMDPERLKNSRMLFDLTGPSYTMVLEGRYKSLAEFESGLAEAFSNKEWGDWYGKFVPIVEGSNREIFSIVEI